MDCDYEDKYVLMYGALEQDYNELREEATEVASLLQQAKENKLRLQAEVKFLKRRALTLRESMRTPDFFCSREPVSESSSKYISGSSRGSIGRMVFAAEAVWNAAGVICRFSNGKPEYTATKHI
ncbi:hypothetical protein KP509_19G045700 [Ceratopteris richardii]|uniref:Uncharacterized protein n=1 Tax=Ceratopteris richardii TaxID=49495 RepID=A0A8T2SP61_CERRI|nr:hypothetical protein KP509_19G045700 [Ceratopteris richardii]